MWMNTWGNSESVPEFCPSGSLNHLYGAFLLGFLLPIILNALVQSPYLVYLRILLCVYIHLLPKWILLKMSMGRASLCITLLLHHSPFGSLPFASLHHITFKMLFCVCVITLLGERKICCLGKAQPPVSIVLLLLFWNFSPQGMSLVKELSPCLIQGTPEWQLLLFFQQDLLWEMTRVPVSSLACDALEKTN